MREMKDSGIEWIGEIPSDWKNETIRNLVLQRDGGTWGEEPDDDVSGTICLRIADFDYIKGRFKKCNEEELTRRKFTESQRSRLALKKGDILIEKSGGGEKTPVGRAVYYSGEYGSVLYANFMERLRFDESKVNPEYIEYWLRAWYSCKSSPYYISQTIGIQNINLTLMLAKERIFYPALCLQNGIISFLDTKCAEIDALAADIQAQIDTLEQYKRSVITEAVTKGLNPDAEMKESGIEWIGRIPAHWKTIRIGRLFHLRDERNYKPLEEVQLLSLYTGIGVFPHGEQEERGNKAVTADGYKIVKANDIVVNIILAWMGAIGISNYDGVTSPAYDVYVPDLSKVVPHYFHYVFRTSGIAGECYKYGRGIMAMRWRTYSSEFKRIFVPYPDTYEQKQIADYLDTKCAEIDDIIKRKREQLATIEEYKKSLIFEYVTGKKEVRT